MAGGDLAYIWTPYQTYIAADKRYGDLHDGVCVIRAPHLAIFEIYADLVMPGFVIAQSWMNLVEVAVGAMALIKVSFLYLNVGVVRSI